MKLETLEARLKTAEEILADVTALRCAAINEHGDVCGVTYTCAACILKRRVAEYFASAERVERTDAVAQARKHSLAAHHRAVLDERDAQDAEIEAQRRANPMSFENQHNTGEKNE